MLATLRQLRRNAEPESRYSLSDVVDWVQSGNGRFPVGVGSIAGQTVETIEESFDSYVQQVYKRNGIVFACMAVRQSVFAEVRFRFAQVREGKVGKLFGTSALDVLERPWPNGTTGELATRMIQDADLAGNFYAVLRNGRLYRRDPSKMMIALSGDPSVDEFVDVAGYVYSPKGDRGPKYTYLPEEVCHWSPIPDPKAEYRGMSWLTPVIREIVADGYATDHKAKFFANGATPSMVVTVPESIMNEDQFNEFKAKMDASYAGARNAYKTLYLVPGADATVVGSQFDQLDFSETQGRDETRIAAAAGVPPVIAGLKESLAGSSLNAGNYSAARRRFADATMRPLYRSAASALESLVKPPQAQGPSMLWYDDSQVAFFREDRKDAAEIQQTKAITIRNLVDAGYDAESVVAAVEAEDMSLLRHSGLFSVQLQEPGAQPTPPQRSQRILRDEFGRMAGIVEEP